MKTPDLILKNGLIIDGTGRPAFEGEVAIQRNWILAVDAPGALQDAADARLATVARCRTFPQIEARVSAAPRQSEPEAALHLLGQRQDTLNRMRCPV